MANELTPLESVQETVKNKIRAEFANLIPDAMWASMVKSVITDFVHDKPDKYDGRRMYPSPMKEMIRKEIEDIARAHLKTELDILGADTWNTYGQKAAREAIKKMLS